MTLQDRDLLAAIVESNDAAIISKSSDGTVLSWNAGAQRLYGYTAAEAIGRHISFLLPPDRADELAENTARAELGRPTDHYETERVCKDGRIVRVSLSVAPVLDPDGRVIATATVAREADARETLRRQGERLANSQRVARVGSWDWDLASGVVTWSEELYLLYGVDPRTFEPSFESFLSCVHPDDRAAVAAEVTAAVAERRGFSMVHRICWPDGSVRTMAARGEPLLGADLLVARMSGTSQDVTESDRDRAALVRSRELLAFAQRVAAVGSWEWDVVADVAEFSDEFYRIFALDPASFHGSLDSLVGLAIEEDRERIGRTVQEALARGQGFDFGCRIRIASGEIRFIHVRSEAVLDDRQRVVRMYGSAQDVTLSKSIENDLRRQTETLELVGRATNDLMWDWDLRTDHVRRNQGLSTYGYTDSDLQPTNTAWKALVHPDDLARVQATVDEALVQGGTTVWSAQFRLRRADGTYADVLDRGYVVRDADGRPVRMVGALVDVSERERAQEMARRGAASAELLARASHELRTPLNAILGFSDLLEQRLEATIGPRERRYLQNIRGSGDHLLQLVDRLLEIAKADSGRLEIHPSVIPLFGLVAPVYAEFSQAAADAQVALDIELPDVTIRVDLERMSTVVRELVANALAATPPGGSVRIRATIPDDGLVLEVIDTGRGIPPEAHARIFQVFQRIHEDGDASRTGLGLALCRELVEAHGGTISFESDPGRGTTFRVHLPHVSWGREKGDRVLVVDDGPNDADLSMTIVRDAGFRCELVGTVAEARAAILRDSPIAVVLDVRLPDGTANDVLEALRSLAPEVPVAVVSAFDDETTPHPGAVRIAKPIDPDALVAWLRKVTAPTEAARR